MKTNKLEIPNTEAGADYRDCINNNIKYYKQSPSEDRITLLINTLLSAANYFQETHLKCAKDIRSVAMNIRDMDIADIPDAVIYH